jgi:hypothetical protein
VESPSGSSPARDRGTLPPASPVWESEGGRNWPRGTWRRERRRQGVECPKKRSDANQAVASETGTPSHFPRGDGSLGVSWRSASSQVRARRVLRNQCCRNAPPEITALWADPAQPFWNGLQGSKVQYPRPEDVGNASESLVVQFGFCIISEAYRERDNVQQSKIRR